MIMKERALLVGVVEDVVVEEGVEVEEIISMEWCNIMEMVPGMVGVGMVAGTGCVGMVAEAEVVEEAVDTVGVEGAMVVEICNRSPVVTMTMVYLEHHLLAAGVGAEGVGVVDVVGISDQMVLQSRQLPDP